LTEWEVNSPVNNKEAKLYGAELAAQHFFGESGFGLQANYTIVRGDIGYKNGEDPSVSQFALLGLSDTMNIVGIYENYGVQARLAYNWRGSFLNNASKGSNRNPIYTEAYSQWDLSVGYNITDDLSVSFEGLNLTGEDRRDHGRTWNMVEYMEDLGPRYAVGARYNF
jgi:TonB-dependent receptor